MPIFVFLHLYFVCKISFLKIQTETCVLFQLCGNNANFDIFITLIVSIFRRGHIKFSIILLNSFTQGIINLVSKIYVANAVSMGEVYATSFLSYISPDVYSDVCVTEPPGALLFDRDQRLH